MPAKRFNEADIDFDAMDGELAKLVPPKLSLTDVLDRLRKRLVEQQAKGVTVAQMHEVLTRLVHAGFGLGTWTGGFPGTRKRISSMA